MSAGQRVNDFIYFVGHLLHSATGCPTCRDEVHFSLNRAYYNIFRHFKKGDNKEK